MAERKIMCVQTDASTVGSCADFQRTAKMHLTADKIHMYANGMRVCMYSNVVHMYFDTAMLQPNPTLN